REGQAVDLGFDRGDDSRMTVAELMNAVAVEIEDPAPLGVDENGAFGSFDHVKAGRRKRLAEKVTPLLIQELPRLGTEPCAPRDAQRREVDVAFAERRPCFGHGRSPRARRASMA